MTAATTPNVVIVEKSSNVEAVSSMRAVIEIARNAKAKSLLLPKSISHAKGTLLIEYEKPQQRRQTLEQFITSKLCDNVNLESLAQQLAKSLLHELRAIHKFSHHGLISPTTVLVDSEEKISLDLYGLAHVERSLKSSPTLENPHLFSPEKIATGEATKGCDIWSVGLCVLRILLGELPLERFPSEISAVLVKDYKSVQPEVLLKSYSRLAQSFVSDCCRVADDRPTAKELLEHDWLRVGVETQVEHGRRVPSPPPLLPQPKPQPAASLDILLSSLKETNLPAARADELQEAISSLALQWEDFPDAFIDAIIPHVTWRPVERLREYMAANFMKSVKCR